MKAEKSNKNKIQFQIISVILGPLFIYTGVSQLVDIKSYQPNFNGRWGWFTHLLYSFFGAYGEPFVMILTGAYVLYIAFIKLNKKRRNQYD